MKNQIDMLRLKDVFTFVGKWDQLTFVDDWNCSIDIKKLFFIAIIEHWNNKNWVV